MNCASELTANFHDETEGDGLTSPRLMPPPSAGGLGFGKNLFFLV
jgi:hypothetical protein